MSMNRVKCVVLTLMVRPLMRMDQRICTRELPKIQEEIESSCQQLSPTVTQGLKNGTHSLNQQMATAGFAGTLTPSTSSVKEESCWLFEDHEGRKPGPHSLCGALFMVSLWIHCGLSDGEFVSSTAVCWFFKLALQHMVHLFLVLSQPFCWKMFVLLCWMYHWISELWPIYKTVHPVLMVESLD